MKIERVVMAGCCGRKITVFKLDRPIQRAFLDFLINNGFTEAEQYTKVGMLYATTSTLVLTGPIGADRITVKCKNGDCEDKILNDLEDLLIKME